MIKCKSCNWRRRVRNRDIAIEIGANHTRKSGHYWFTYEPEE